MVQVKLAPNHNAGTGEQYDLSEVGHTHPSHAHSHDTDLTGVSADDHHAQAHEAAHASGGADAFVSTEIIEAVVKRLQESAGPTTLLLGAVADGQHLQRSGTSIIGVAAPSAGMNTLRKTANQTINAGAGVFTDIADLTFPVVAGVDYAFEFYITFRSAATGTGWKAGVNCPAGTLDFWAGSDVIANGAAGVATHTERHNVVRDDMTQLTATITANVDLNVRIKGRYLCTADGTFAARFASELANTDIVVQKGSWGWWF